MCRFKLCVFKQKTADAVRISDWSSDVCSSELREDRIARLAGRPLRDDRELDEALIALVAVEIVVIIAGQREIFEVRAAAEHLDPVVRAVVDLDVIERGA